MAGERERGRTGNAAGGATRTGTRAQEVRSRTRRRRKCDTGNVTREAEHASGEHGMAWGRMAAKRKRGALAAGKAKRARSAPSAGEAVPEGGPQERSGPPQEYSIPPPVSQVPPLGPGPGRPAAPGLGLSEGTRLLSRGGEVYS